MRPLLVCFFLFLIVFSFSSCFDTVEELSLNKDGSGKMVLTFNASQSKAKVATLQKLGKVNGYIIPSNTAIKNELTETVKQLNTMPGISKAIYTTDFSNYIISLSFEFNNVGQLNAAVKKILQSYNIPANNVVQYNYNAAAKSFATKFQLEQATKSKYAGLKSEDKEMFQTAKYTSVYRFASVVNTMSHKDAKLSGSKKAVMHQVPFTYILEKNYSINNTINLQ